MKRRWTKLFAVLAALVALIATAIWMRSHFVLDELRISGDRRIELIFARGVATLTVESHFSGAIGNYNYRNVAPGDRLWLGDRWGRRTETFHIPIRSDVGPRTGLFGFSLSHFDFTTGEGLLYPVRFVNWQISVPLWLCVSVPLVLCLAAIRHLRKTAMRVGICSRCGYDLRASPERCPECGENSELAAPSTE